MSASSEAIVRLRRMRLNGMADALERCLRDASEEQRQWLEASVGECVAAQWAGRAERRLARLLAVARLEQPAACLEDLKMSAVRGRHRETIHALSGCAWVAQGQQMLITGPSEAGKTYLACAWGTEAMRRGFSVRYWEARALFDACREERFCGRTGMDLVDADLLILDNWALEPLDLPDLCQASRIVSARWRVASTVLVSPVPVAQWAERLTDPALCEHIAGRFAVAHRFELRK